MVGEFIPIIAIVAVFGLFMQRNYLRYSARRSLPDPEMEGRVAQLEQEMDGVRGQLAETQERLDFAERMLTQVRDAQKLPPGPAPSDPTRKL